MLTIALPLLVIAGTNDLANKQTIHIVKDNLSPVIAYLEKEISRNGHPPSDIMGEVEKVNSAVKNVTYFAGAGHYVVSVSVASLDIEGAIIYYSDLDKVWRHENTISIEGGETDSAVLFQKATAGLAKRVYWVDYSSGRWQSKEVETVSLPSATEPGIR
ncbi:MAG: hypothetical protein C4575_06720 [Desulforudis sp.]|nr:MAG: hypothetical protein C4575_06720 [Desulforudis sp.]